LDPTPLRQTEFVQVTNRLNRQQLHSKHASRRRCQLSNWFAACRPVVRSRGCGQLCVRGGQKHWLRTLEHFPDRFTDYEVREQRFRERTGKNVAILKERRAGRTLPLPLAELRRRHNAYPATDVNAAA